MKLITITLLTIFAATALSAQPLPYYQGAIDSTHPEYVAELHDRDDVAKAILRAIEMHEVNGEGRGILYRLPDPDSRHVHAPQYEFLYDAVVQICEFEYQLGSRRAKRELEAMDFDQFTALANRMEHSDRTIHRKDSGRAMDGQRFWLWSLQHDGRDSFRLSGRENAVRASILAGLRQKFWSVPANEDVYINMSDVDFGPLNKIRSISGRLFYREFAVRTLNRWREYHNYPLIQIHGGYPYKETNWTEGDSRRIYYTIEGMIYTIANEIGGEFDSAGEFYSHFFWHHVHWGAQVGRWLWTSGETSWADRGAMIESFRAYWVNQSILNPSANFLNVHCFSNLVRAGLVAEDETGAWLTDRGLAFVAYIDHHNGNVPLTLRPEAPEGPEVPEGPDAVTPPFTGAP